MEQFEEDRRSYLSQKAIPAALTSLAGKQETLTQVVQYLEENYVSTDVDKRALEVEAKKFLVNALTSVVTDIESAAGSFEQLLGLSLNEVESLTNQVELLQSTMRLSREQASSNSFRELNMLQEPLVGLEYREVEATAQSSTPRALPHGERYTLAKRLSELENIGISLHKPSQSSSPLTAGPGSMMSLPSSSSALSSSSPSLLADPQHPAFANSPSPITTQSANLQNALMSGNNTAITGRAGTARSALLNT